MSNTERPSLGIAMRAVDAAEVADDGAKLKTCLALIQHCVQRICDISIGSSLPDAEQIGFRLDVENAMHAFLAAKSDKNRRRLHFSATSSLDEIADSLDKALSGPAEPLS